MQSPIAVVSFSIFLFFNFFHLGLFLNLPYCEKLHRNYVNLNHIQANPEVLTIPHGLAFLSSKFGIGYIVTIPEESLKTFSEFSVNQRLQAFNLSVNPGHALAARILLCRVRNRHKYSPATAISLDSCSPTNHTVTFGARIVGPEILLGSINQTPCLTSIDHTSTSSGAITKKDSWVSDRRTCYFHVQFPPITVEGNYRLEIYTSYLNGDVEPSPELRAQPTQERVNLPSRHNYSAVGYNSSAFSPMTAVSLSGIGEHSMHVCDRSWTRLDIEGLLFEPCFSRNMGCYRKWYVIQDKAKRQLESWEVAVASGYSKSDVWQVRAAFLSEFRDGPVLTLQEASLRDRPPLSHEAVAVLSRLAEVRVLRYGESAWRGALLPGAPDLVFVTRNGTGAGGVYAGGRGGDVVSSSLLPSSLSSLSAPFCSSGSDPGRWVWEPRCVDGLARGGGLGGECTHSQPPRAIGDREGTGVVGGSGGLHTHRQGQGQRLSPEWEWEWKSGALRSLVWRPERCQLRHYDGPALSGCLAKCGVRLLAGFGDSLGDEQLSNVAALLVSPAQGSSSGTAGTHSHMLNVNKVELICSNSAMNRNNNPGKYIHRVTNFYGLTTCIDGVLKRSGGRHANTTVVLVTNFMALWMIREHPMSAIYAALDKQAEVHAYYTRKVYGAWGVTYRKILLTGTAIGGFRAGGTTPQRVLRFNSYATRVLSGAGWEVLDVYNVTLGRPDGSVDGVHYRGGVANAVTDLLTTTLCSCDKQTDLQIA